MSEPVAAAPKSKPARKPRPKKTVNSEPQESQEELGTVHKITSTGHGAHVETRPQGGQISGRHFGSVEAARVALGGTRGEGAGAVTVYLDGKKI